MPRFYIETDLAVNTTIELTETVFHHWVKVLRAKLGETATLFNGQGGEYQATLTEINKKTASVSIDHFNADDRTPAKNTLIGQVMSKGDRMDYAIQKAVELGVWRIQLLTSERCEMRLKYDRDQKKIEHWQGIAIAACEQCGMNRVPEILAPISLEAWLQSDLPESRLVLAPNKNQQNVLQNTGASLAVLIGPEGGLSEIEIETANTAGFINWCVGDRILRTETAPIVALTLINFA